MLDTTEYKLCVGRGMDELEKNVNDTIRKLTESGYTIELGTLVTDAFGTTVVFYQPVLKKRR